MTLFTEGRLQAYERMMQDTGKIIAVKSPIPAPAGSTPLTRSLKRRLLRRTVFAMAVFRVEKNANYTTMSNYHLRDKQLSLKAKGLLSFCLSLPDTWDYSIMGLAAVCKEGRDCIMSTLQELEELGYLRRERTRNADGKQSVVKEVLDL